MLQYLRQVNNPMTYFGQKLRLFKKTILTTLLVPITIIFPQQLNKKELMREIEINLNYNQVILREALIGIYNNIDSTYLKNDLNNVNIYDSTLIQPINATLTEKLNEFGLNELREVDEIISLWASNVSRYEKVMDIEIEKEMHRRMDASPDHTTEVIGFIPLDLNEGKFIASKELLDIMGCGVYIQNAIDVIGEKVIASGIIDEMRKNNFTEDAIKQKLGQITTKIEISNSLNEYRKNPEIWYKSFLTISIIVAEQFSEREQEYFKKLLNSPAGKKLNYTVSALYMKVLEQCLKAWSKN